MTRGDPIDCLVIGGGPAGLSAAIYLARFHLAVRVIDGGGGRARSIPRTRNHPGYPDGIAGAELVDRMMRQAAEYGARIEHGAVADLARDGDDFVAAGPDGPVRARAVLIATGVVNRRPPMPDDLHDAALAAGLIRYCPICDGYEVTDRRVGVIGGHGRGPDEAIFLRGYTRDVTLVAPAPIASEEQRRLADAGIAIRAEPATGFHVEDGRLCVEFAGDALHFDSLYPAMGSEIRSELARAAGARTSEDGCLEVDAHQRTDVPGLYAAGDVVKGLDQISHAMGEGGVAATTIRNDLAKRMPLYR